MAIAYVANRDSNTVSVISTQSNQIITRIHVGRGPSGITIIPTRLSQPLIKHRKKVVHLSRPLIKRRKGLYSAFVK